MAPECMSPILVPTGPSVRRPATDQLPFRRSLYVVPAPKVYDQVVKGGEILVTWYSAH